HASFSWATSARRSAKGFSGRATRTRAGDRVPAPLSPDSGWARSAARPSWRSDLLDAPVVRWRQGWIFCLCPRSSSVRHHVALSVVGTERLLASGYFRAKMAQEGLIKASKIPYTIVRATQFFEFVGGVAQFSTEVQTVRLTPALMQPIAADNVAAILAD